MRDVESETLLSAADTTIAAAVEKSEQEHGGEFNSPDVNEILVWAMLVPLLISLLAGSIQSALLSFRRRNLSKRDIADIKQLLKEKKCNVKALSVDELKREIDIAVRSAMRNDEQVKAAVLNALESWADPMILPASKRESDDKASQ